MRYIFSTSIIIGISRLSGFIRELVFSIFIGTSYIMDAFVIAFMIPNFFRRILGEKAADSVFVPIYIREREKGKEHSNRYMSNVFTTLGIFLIAGTLIFYLLAPFFIRIVAPGFDPATYKASLLITLIILPYMFFIGLYAFGGALLESHKRFLIYNLAPLLFNLSLVIAVVFFYKKFSVVALSIGVLAGVLLQTLFLFTDFHGLNLRYRPVVNLKDSKLRLTGKLLIPVTVGSGVEKLSIYVDRILASFLPTGSISALHFSFLLVDLPFAVFSIAISKVIHPYISEGKNYSNKRNFYKFIRRGVILNAAVLIPATVLFMLFPKQIISVVYMRGAFDSQSVEMTFRPFLFYSLSLFPMGLVQLFSRGFYALLNTKTPLYVAFLSTLINLFASIILMPSMGASGLALGTSISVWFNALYLLSELKKRIEKNEN